MAGQGFASAIAIACLKPQLGLLKVHAPVVPCLASLVMQSLRMLHVRLEQLLHVYGPLILVSAMRGPSLKASLKSDLCNARQHHTGVTLWQDMAALPPTSCFQHTRSHDVGRRMPACMMVVPPLAIAQSATEDLQELFANSKLPRNAWDVHAAPEMNSEQHVSLL